MTLHNTAPLSIAPYDTCCNCFTPPHHHTTSQLCHYRVAFHIRKRQPLPACCRDPGSPLSGEDGDPTSPPRPDFEPLAEDPHDEGRLGDQVLLLAVSPSLA